MFLCILEAVSRHVVGQFPFEDMKYFNSIFYFFAPLSRQRAALTHATQYAMPPEFGRKWHVFDVGTICLP